MGAFDDLIPAKSGGGAFDDLIPKASPTPTATAVADTGEEGDGFLAKINAALRKPSPEVLQAPEQAVRELVSGMVPHDLPSYLESIYPPAAAARLGANVAQGDISGLPLVGRVPEIMQAEDTPAGSKERYLTAMKTLMDVGMLAGAGAERPPEPLAAPRVPEPPPTQPIGPGTTAADVSNALDWTPQSPPITPLESAVAKVQPPGPYVSPETGFTHYPGFGEGHVPIPSETARLPAPPTPPIGTPLQPMPLLGPPGTTAADAATAQVPPPVASVPEPYTPEAAAARAQQPLGAQPTEGVGGNVAGFEKVYGHGEVAAGETISPEGAWDAAHARAQSGKAQPYGFVDRARSGAITPEEMGDLIYEHHRLVERAAGMEGTPEYDGAYQAAKDFAANVLKPAETAWHQKGMTMQIARPVDLTNMTGMDQLMQSELGRGIKPSEAPKFKQMSQDIQNGQSEVKQAVARSDAKVQRSYAKVADIPIEEAVARVKQMLKDCM